MLQGEHSAILSTFIKLPFVIEIFVLSIFAWPFYTGSNLFTDQTAKMRRLNTFDTRILRLLSKLRFGRVASLDLYMPYIIYTSMTINYSNSTLKNNQISYE